jgi:DNA modification methylase
MEKLNVHFVKKNLLLNKCECGGELEEIEIPAGIVLDPFMGSGTVGVVAKKMGRSYIGIELNSEYIKIAEKRIKATSKTIEAIIKQGEFF